MNDKVRKFILRLRVRFLVWSYNQHVRRRRASA
jgi:hypothetical protein